MVCARWFWVPVTLLLFGCNRAVELRTIEQAMLAVDHNDLQQLRQSTSYKFENRALRSTEALDDLKILPLPAKGQEISVVKVEDVSETEKSVSVEVGESKRKLLYKLVREESSKKWVVDDIYIRQRQEGLVAQRSVTELMDLLLTVREFLTDWKAGEREQILAGATPEFAADLEKLPELYLKQMANEVVGEKAIESSHKPEAHLDEEIAMVKLPRTSGTMTIAFRLDKDESSKATKYKWKVSDVSVDTSDESKRILSVRKRTKVLSGSVAFLDAYAREDKRVLRDATTKEFYEGALAAAKLSSMPLPGGTAPPEAYRIRTYEHHAEFMIPGEVKVYNLVLKVFPNEEDPTQPPIFRVNDVAIFDVQSRQQVQLSAYFTSHAVLELFTQAVHSGDLKVLRHLVTDDFQARVWEPLAGTPLTGFSFFNSLARKPEILATDFQGDITRLKVQQGDQQINYELRNWNGRVLVDDLRFTTTIHPASLKDTMDVLIPVQRFALAYQNNNVEELRRLCTHDFNRTIWGVVKEVPLTPVPVESFLFSPLAKIQPRQGDVLVHLGTQDRGARILLVNQNEKYIIEDVQLIAGPLPDQQVRLKQTLRDHLQNQIVSRQSGGASLLEPVYDGIKLPGRSPSEVNQGQIAPVSYPGRSGEVTPAGDPTSPMQHQPGAPVSPPAYPSEPAPQPAAGIELEDSPYGPYASPTTPPAETAGPWPSVAPANTYEDIQHFSRQAQPTAPATPPAQSATPESELSDAFPPLDINF